MRLIRSNNPSSFFTWKIVPALFLALAGTFIWAVLPVQAVVVDAPTIQDAPAAPSPKEYYQIQTGTPVYLRNIHHTGAGCDWMGVAGQIFSADAQPVSGLKVELGGTLDGVPQSQSVRSGTSAQYGPGGYEIVISDQPAASQASLWLQIVDNDGDVRSNQIPFDTYAGCDRNLVIINFVASDQVPPTPSGTPVKSPVPQKTMSATAIATRTQPAPLEPTSTRTRTPEPGATPTATRFSPAYLRQPGSPLYQTNFAHPERGCKWMGVAGQVLDIDKKPIDGLFVHVDGLLNGKTVSEKARTGSALDYGQGGYEITLASNSSSTTGSLYVTLYDAKGLLLSRKEYFSTYADCRRNLIRFTFVQNPALPTFTPAPSDTPEPSATAIPSTSTGTATRPPSATPLVSSTPRPYFDVQPGSPLYVRNLFRPEKGCDWLGIGGQVLGFDGQPLSGILVEAGGTIAGKDVFALGLTGASPRYGTGGYELYLGDEAVDSIGTVWVMLRDLQGRRLTEHIYLDTYSDCQKNLAYMTFVQTR